MISYVVGLAFEDPEHVLLVDKKRPEWQTGLYNGIGGKIEPAELPRDAMTREAIEEAGLNVDWQLFLTIHHTDATIFFYRHHAGDMGLHNEWRTRTDEEVVRLHWSKVERAAFVRDLDWILPLAAYSNHLMPIEILTYGYATKEDRDRFTP